MLTRLTTKGNTAPPQADVRVITSGDMPIVLSDNTTTVQVKGTTLEQPPQQGVGGGVNSSLVVDLGPNGLAPGASLPVQVMMGVMVGGSLNYTFMFETLQSTSSTPKQVGKCFPAL